MTFLCQQCDIAPSFSRLHGILSRATVRRNTEEPFLWARFRPAAATLTKSSYRLFEGLPGIGCGISRAKANRQEMEE